MSSPAGSIATAMSPHSHKVSAAVVQLRTGRQDVLEIAFGHQQAKSGRMIPVFVAVFDNAFGFFYGVGRDGWLKDRPDRGDFIIPVSTVTRLVIGGLTQADVPAFTSSRRLAFQTGRPRFTLEAGGMDPVVVALEHAVDSFSGERLPTPELWDMMMRSSETLAGVVTRFTSQVRPKDAPK